MLREKFEKIITQYHLNYFDIISNGLADKFEKIDSGASKKILYYMVIDDLKYLFIDFTLSDENPKHFYDLTIYFSKSSYCFPKVYYISCNCVITEYVGNSTETTTLENFSNNTVKYKFIGELYLQCIDWIVQFKKSSCDLIGINSLEINKKISLDNLTKFINIVKPNHYTDQIFKLLNELYNDYKITLAHNDFHFGNIMIDSNNQLKIIDYHDCGFNTKHYDIVAFLYHPKKYFSENMREKLLKYYYLKNLNNIATIDWDFIDKIQISSVEYENFKLQIKKTAFVRLCRSLLLRFKKILSEQNQSWEFYTEVRRGVWELKLLEKHTDIYISDDLEKLLPMNNILSVVLCAGKGTRMKNDLPKCASKILNIPMIEYISNTINMLGSEKNIYVVGYKKEIIVEIIKNCSVKNDYFVNQDIQLGTGHAMIQTIPELHDEKIVLVIMGDMPVLTFNLLKQIINYHINSGSVTTAVTSELQVENSSGKILRDEQGKFIKIIDSKDIDLLYKDKQALKIKSIKEVHTGIYVFNSTCLKKYLVQLNCSNAQNEYYLTDILELQKKDGLVVDCVKVSHVCEPTGANTPEELQMIEKNFSQY
jgi:bifunctional UDP-N-acetylglucosamine pyrophosphorylase/glucosamine-1-phosphate N-acetyltransferase